MRRHIYATHIGSATPHGIASPPFFRRSLFFFFICNGPQTLKRSASHDRTRVNIIVISMECILQSCHNGLVAIRAATVPQVTTQATPSHAQAHPGPADMFRSLWQLQIDELVHAICRTAP